MTDPTDTTPDPNEPDPNEHLLIEMDFASFTYAERLEVQRAFDCDFPDMWDYIVGKARLNGRIDTTVKMLDRNGNVHFADEILRHMVWVQRKRTDPAAQLTDLDHLNWGAMVKTLRRRPKAGTASTRPRKP